MITKENLEFCFWVCIGLMAAGILLSFWKFGVGIRKGMKEGELEYRVRTNRCLACGYRMKGNVSGVWPECGTDERKL